MKLQTSIFLCLSLVYGLDSSLENYGPLHNTLYSLRYSSDSPNDDQLGEDRNPLMRQLQKRARVMYLLLVKTCIHSQELNLDVSAVRIDFHDYANDFEQSFLINSAAQGILNVPGLNKTNKFAIFVPGFISAITPKSLKLIREGFSKLSDTYVLILHDFVYTNPGLNAMTSYRRSVTYVYYIGKALANLLIDLNNGGISPKNIHLIGHSLGAHIVGYTGKVFNENVGTKISRITGLDPAGPCYENAQHQLRSNEADFVDIYHCNAGEYGTNYDLGHANFYLNKNGRSQPGCGSPLIPDLILSGGAVCSHMACQNFFFATVGNTNLFPASQCESYALFKSGDCQKNEKILAGYRTPDNATGIYYLSTAGYDIKYLFK